MTAEEGLVPRQVDHEHRRREVTAVAAELVATRGRAALTARSVAELAGYSTTVVTHYFTDMADLLHETYAFAAARAHRRITEVLEADPSDIAGLAEALLPLDKERRDDWLVWLAFWSEALASPALIAEQRRRARTAVERFATCLELLARQGRLPGVDVTEAADRLGALVNGIASEAVFDQQRWSAARQRRVLQGELDQLGLT